MRTLTLGFGREVNAPYNGRKIESSARGVWLLDVDAWLTLQSELINLAHEFGTVVFAGTGYGLDTVTGKVGEPGFVVVIEYLARVGGVQELQDRAAIIARSYGQLHFAFTDGESETVGA